MSTSDKTQQPAKPVKHEDTSYYTKASFEHKDITDNRLVWEVLEEGDNE